MAVAREVFTTALGTLLAEEEDDDDDYDNHRQTVSIKEAADKPAVEASQHEPAAESSGSSGSSSFATSRRLMADDLEQESSDSAKVLPCPLLSFRAPSDCMQHSAACEALDLCVDLHSNAIRHASGRFTPGQDSQMLGTKHT